MKNPSKAWLAVLLLFPCLQALAIGTEGGGGENSVVCFSDSKIASAIRDTNSPRFGEILNDEIKSGKLSSIEAYDLYEARIPRGLTRRTPVIVDIRSGESTRDYVERIAKRFEPYIPAIAKIIRTGTNIFGDSRILMRPAGLKRIHDENDVGTIDAEHCVVATMAAQYNSGDQTFLQVDDRLFSNSLHSGLSQSVLFLHESVYYSARVFAAHNNSRATRTLISTLINAAAIHSTDIEKLLNDLHMPFLDSGTNTLALIVEKAFEETKKSREAKIDKVRAVENKKLMQQFKAWQQSYPGIYGPLVIWSGGNHNSQWLAAPQEDEGGYNTEKDEFDLSGLKSKCTTYGSSCLSSYVAIIHNMKAALLRLRQIGLADLSDIAKNRIFPQIDQAVQYDSATIAKAKEIISRDFSHANVDANLSNAFAGGLRMVYSKDFDADQDLHLLDYMIP